MKSALLNETIAIKEDLKTIKEGFKQDYESTYILVIFILIAAAVIWFEDKISDL